MKFGENYESHITTEWRDQYMNYALLKAIIKRSSDPNVKRAAIHLEFFEEINVELEKVNYFFQLKLAEARRKHATLKIQLFNSVIQHGTSKRSLRATTENTKPMKNHQLRFALSEFYLSLILLQNYQVLNYTGFSKICKKFDKYLNSEDGARWLARNVEYAPFNLNRTLKLMIKEIEELYTEYLEKGDRSRAMAKLRVPPLGEPINSYEIFRAAFFLGMFLVLAAVAVITLYAHPLEAGFYDAFTSLYRGPFTWVIFMFYMAFNIAGFQRFGVNYILIFELDPRDHLNPANYLEYAALFGIIWSLSMLGFLYHNELGVSPFWFPFILLVVMIGSLINPLPIMRPKSRFWLLRLVGRVVCAPFFYVGFADFWLGDQLNSLVICIADYYFMIRFYVLQSIHKDCAHCFSEDYFVFIARCLPPWFRFAQCLRRYFESDSKAVSYLINAIKYSTSFVVTFFLIMRRITNDDYPNVFANPYVWGFLISSIISTIFCIWWDLLRDFGICRVWSGSKVFLRNQLMYPTFFYHFVIVENIVIRFFWAIEFFCVYYRISTPNVFRTAASILEITRRFIWNYLRLENEHLNNCGRFRATRDIFVPTLNVDDQLRLESMIQEDELTYKSKNFF